MIKSVVLFLTVCSMLASMPASATIRVLVASQNAIKSAAVREAFNDRFPLDQIEVIEYKTDSKIPEQPVGKDIALKGAKNRIGSLPENLINSADYIVSIENYIEQSAPADSWRDFGLVLLQKPSKPNTEKVFLTQATPIPSKFIQMAREASTPSKITSEGFPVTIGKMIQKNHADRRIDSHDWHKDPEFGGISRQRLLEEALYKALHAEDIEFVKSHIALYPDFPKPGIVFEDFTPLLSNDKAFQKTIDILYERYKSKNIQAVVGLESRGFILGAALAYKLGVGFVPVRKPGKLPGPTYSVSYVKEYGSDTLVISQKALSKDERVLVIDDLIATGGSAKAAIELVKKAGGIPVEFVSLLEVKGLDGRSKLGIPSFNLLD